MKNLFYLVLALFAIGIFACNEKDDPKPQSDKFDMSAMVKINPYKKGGIKSTTMSYDDSVKFIAKYTRRLYLLSKQDNDNVGIMSISEDQRDSVNHRILWYGSNVVYETTSWGDTTLHLGGFIVDYYNLVFTVSYNTLSNEVIHPDSALGDYWRLDTVAYIPNSVVYKARELITEAFEKKDYKRCYELFDSAYVFIPTTGEKYRALMEKGEN